MTRCHTHLRVLQVALPLGNFRRRAGHEHLHPDGLPDDVARPAQVSPCSMWCVLLGAHLMSHPLGETSNNSSIVFTEDSPNRHFSLPNASSRRIRPTKHFPESEESPDAGAFVDAKTRRAATALGVCEAPFSGDPLQAAGQDGEHLVQTVRPEKPRLYQNSRRLNHLIRALAGLESLQFFLLAFISSPRAVGKIAEFFINILLR